MPAPIEDYALLSDCRTAALVSLEGSIDWLCVPRLDSPSVFGALLGDAEHGCWSLKPNDEHAITHRWYEGDTFVLVTRWETETGVAEVRDVMPFTPEPHVGTHRIDVIRRVTGMSGTVDFTQNVRFRFDYSRAVPWVRQTGTAEEPELLAMAGPDAIVLRGAEVVAVDHAHRGTVTVEAGESVDLTLTWFPSHLPAPAPIDAALSIESTHAWWQHWADEIEYEGPYRDLVIRSLLTLRALTNHETGGIAAAATTSLPEEFGGVRNWDYRFVWLRDAALTLEALLVHGFTANADHWREWLLRAVAGDPAELQIMYGLAGERDLTERVLDSFPGYEGSAPVRIGNGAAHQFQADVVGEVLVTLSAARDAGLDETEYSWPLQRELVSYVAEHLDRPDHGLWEIRGEPKLFTHSRAMVWATFDRAVRAVEEHGLKGPVEKWHQLRAQVREEIDSRGVTNGHFTQHYDTDEVDASLLLLPQIGFCSPDDPRMLATVEKIENDLMRDGLLIRYRTDTEIDGLPGEDYPFLACSFWLVEQYAQTNRFRDAYALMDRLCGLANDVGLLAEEYDTQGRRHAGNFPQAFSHLALVRAADALSRVHLEPR